MNLKMHWVAALLGSLGALNSAAWSPPVNEFAEVFFARDSAALLPQTHDAKFLICLAKKVDLEVLVAEGHADVGERNPFADSLERVLAVKGWLVGNGIDPKRIYPESKGAFESFGENHVVNRRVAIEFSGRLGRIPVSDCDPIWKSPFWLFH